MRKYFITGLLILVPLAITAWVLNLVISTMDQSLLFVPERWQPRTLFGFDIPGLGTILTIVIVFLTGLLTNNLVGNYIVRQRLPQGRVDSVSAPEFVDHRLFDRRAGRRCEEPPGGRLRQRLRADDAEPDFGIFPDVGAQGRRRARHERRRRPQVHRLDGRGGAGPCAVAAG